MDEKKVVAGKGVERERERGAGLLTVFVCEGIERDHTKPTL